MAAICSQAANKRQARALASILGSAPHEGIERARRSDSLDDVTAHPNRIAFPDFETRLIFRRPFHPQVAAIFAFH
ncbi:hypothetical protein [Methylocystis sp.]|uniref:hypothetical protein n=1 Tax=Methylocystis sp. TaxID=1911079 RepID=UPI003D110D93